MINFAEETIKALNNRLYDVDDIFNSHICILFIVNSILLMLLICRSRQQQVSRRFP